MKVSNFCLSLELRVEEVEMFRSGEEVSEWRTREVLEVMMRGEGFEKNYYTVLAKLFKHDTKIFKNFKSPKNRCLKITLRF